MKKKNDSTLLGEVSTAVGRFREGKILPSCEYTVLGCSQEKYIGLSKPYRELGLMMRLTMVEISMKSLKFNLL